MPTFSPGLSDGTSSGKVGEVTPVVRGFDVMSFLPLGGVPEGMGGAAGAVVILIVMVGATTTGAVTRGLRVYFPV